MTEYIVTSISAVCLIGSSILLWQAWRVRNDALDILNEAYRMNQKFTKLTVYGWKCAIAGYEERGDYETCAKIKAVIEGKADEEVVETPEGLYVYANPNEGILVHKI